MFWLHIKNIQYLSLETCLEMSRLPVKLHLHPIHLQIWKSGKRVICPRRTSQQCCNFQSVCVFRSVLSWVQFSVRVRSRAAAGDGTVYFQLYERSIKQQRWFLFASFQQTLLKPAESLDVNRSRSFSEKCWEPSRGIKMAAYCRL